MTPGHLSDEMVLRNTIKMNVGYIGMMASHKKKDEILHKLRCDGINEKSLKKILCPVGIQIKQSNARINSHQHCC